ncbi:hypothetical protein lerEdw1_004674 [Lerista edwardsae]|nr:hypothetical protein lerEdw1_004674 [Lerista edwardsae]
MRELRSQVFVLRGSCFPRLLGFLGQLLAGPGLTLPREEPGLRSPLRNSRASHPASVSAPPRLSGLSPFLGDNDTETLNNVLASNWYFDDEAFEGISDEAKDFVSHLIIKDKSFRMNAAQCLQHPWLNNLAEKAKIVNRRLKSQVLLRKYVMRRRWKKNFIGVCAANRFKKITSSGSLTALGV